MGRVKVSQRKRKAAAAATAARRHREDNGEVLGPTATTNKKAPKNMLSFRQILPQEGFAWPIFVQTTTTHKQARSIALDDRHIAVLLSAIRRGYICIAKLRKVNWDARTDEDIEHERAYCQEELARLVFCAVELLEDANFDITKLDESPEPHIEFWERLMKVADTLAAGGTEKSPAWFSSSQKNPVRSLTGEALFELVRVAVHARRFAVEHNNLSKEGEEGNPFEATSAGNLASAVDDLIEVLQTKYAGHQAMKIAYFGPLSGVAHVGQYAVDKVGVNEEAEESEYEEDAPDVDDAINEMAGFTFKGGSKGGSSAMETDE